MAPIEEIFCEIDDYCKAFFPAFERGLLPSPNAKRKRAIAMSAGEIMTILVLFHLSHYHDFKNFYLDCVTRQMRDCFPRLLSYSRFVEVQGRVFPALCAFMKHKSGHETSLYYVDSTTLGVCRNQRIPRHQTFERIAQRGKSSMGWFFDFKLHVVINHIGEIMAFCLTPGNTDDRKPVPNLFKNLKGLAAGDKGYISKKLTDELTIRHQAHHQNTPQHEAGGAFSLREVLSGKARNRRGCDRTTQRSLPNRAHKASKTRQLPDQHACSIDRVHAQTTKAFNQFQTA